MELATNVPSELSKVIQSVVILFMAAQASFAAFSEEFLARFQFRKGQANDRRGGK